MMKRKHIHFVLTSLWMAMSLSACEKYLAQKPDKALAIVTTEADLQSLLDNVSRMNYNYAAGLAEIGSDNIFIPYDRWSSIAIMEDREAYVWGRVPVVLNYWSSVYQKVLVCNTVLEVANEVPYATTQQRNAIVGTASFFRGFAFLDLAQVFAVPYNAADADSQKGVVLRLSSDVNLPSKRATLQETYDRITIDLIQAARLLPEGPAVYPTRPTKAAAYGALARCYLAMRDYAKAGAYADSSLRLHRDLIDYNTIDVEIQYPFERFNEEVILYTQMAGGAILSSSRVRVDSTLYDSYADADLRKSAFFTPMPDGYYAFTGDYGGNSSAAKFSGITTAEMLLIRAECYARSNDTDKALIDLRELMSNRYRDMMDDDIEGISNAQALELILAERRKELIFRGLRWSDIRRLAAEGRDISFVRELDRTYDFDRDDILSFAYLIPLSVIERSNIEQN